MERLWSMWGLAMALGTIGFIAAVASRQRWLIVTNGGLLLVAFAPDGIGGWPGTLLFWTGLAMVGIGLLALAGKRPSQHPHRNARDR